MCKYCEGEVSKRKNIIEYFNRVYVYIDIYNNLCCSGENNFVSNKIKFCPICGRKLEK